MSVTYFLWFSLQPFKGIKTIRSSLAIQKQATLNLAHAQRGHWLPALQLWEVLSRNTGDSVEVFFLILEHHI